MCGQVFIKQGFKLKANLQFAQGNTAELTVGESSHVSNKC